MENQPTKEDLMKKLEQLTNALDSKKSERERLERGETVSSDTAPETPASEAKTDAELRNEAIDQRYNADNPDFSTPRVGPEPRPWQGGDQGERDEDYERSQEEAWQSRLREIESRRENDARDPFTFTKYGPDRSKKLDRVLNKALLALAVTAAGIGIMASGFLVYEYETHQRDRQKIEQKRQAVKGAGIATPEEETKTPEQAGILQELSEEQIKEIYYTNNEAIFLDNTREEINGFLKKLEMDDVMQVIKNGKKFVFNMNGNEYDGESFGKYIKKINEVTGFEPTNSENAEQYIMRGLTKAGADRKLNKIQVEAAALELAPVPRPAPAPGLRQAQAPTTAPETARTPATPNTQEAKAPVLPTPEPIEYVPPGPRDPEKLRQEKLREEIINKIDAEKKPPAAPGAVQGYVPSKVPEEKAVSPGPGTVQGYIPYKPPEQK